MKKTIIGIIIGLLVGVGAVGAYLYFNNSNGDTKNNKEENKEEVKNDNEMVDEKEGINGQYYLFDGLINKRRYYLALDSAYSTTDINTSGLEDKKTYLVDMNLSSSQPAIKEINLASLLKPFYDKKINNLPETLAAGTTNAMPKSECTGYSIKYGEVNDIPMVDWTKEVAFEVAYTCNYLHNGVGKAEHSLGTEIYKLDIEKMVITHLGSK